MPEPVQSLSALTLVVSAMERSVRFYSAAGFVALYGGPDTDFTSFRAGTGFLNLQLGSPPAGSRLWGRAIFWVDDVDAMHARLGAAGYRAETEPADAPWGERYFHVRDPDGHEISFARPL